MPSAPRRRLRWLAVAAGALAGLAALVWIALPALIERAVTSALERRGVSPVRLDVRRIGPGGIEVADLRLGAGLRVERIAASWSASGARARTLDRVRVEGLRVEVTQTDDGLTVAGLEPLLERGEAPAAPGVPALPVTVLELEDARVSLRAAGGPDRLAHVESAALRFADGGLERARAHGRVDLPEAPHGLHWRVDLSRGGALGAHGSARVESTDTHIRLSLDLPRDAPRGRLDVALGGLDLPGLARGAGLTGALDLALAGDALVLGSPSGLTLRADVLEPAGVGPLELVVAPELALTYRDGVATVLATGCTRVRVAPFSVPGVLRLEAPIEICVETHEGPLLRAGLAEPAGPGLRAALRVGATPLALAVRAGGRLLAVEGRTPHLTLRVDAGAPDAAGAPAEVALEARGGALQIDALALDAAQIDAELRFAAGGGAPLRPSGRVRVGRLASRASPARFGALEVEAALEPAGDEARFRAQARRARTLAVTIVGRSDWSGARGEARTEAAIRLDSDRAAGDILPFLADALGRVRGALEVDGVVRWSPRGLDGDWTLRAPALDAAAQGIAIEGLAGALRLTGWPPETPAPARFTAREGSWGQPFEDGLVVLGVDSTQRITIHEARIATLGGHVRASGAFDLRAGRQSLDVTLDGIDLAKLVSGLGTAGLTATGTLDGSVEAVVEPDGLRLRDGVVAARDDGGWIRHRPPGQPPVPYDVTSPQALTRAALQNFRYTALRGTLAGEAEGDLQIALRVDGANPDLYDGHPIRLDLNLNGPFVALLRSSQAPLQVPQAIERRLGGEERR